MWRGRKRAIDENLDSKTSNPNLKEEKARQKCDIYSFSIISHEVIFEQGPYWTGPYNSGKFSKWSFHKLWSLWSLIGCWALIGSHRHLASSNLITLLRKRFNQNWAFIGKTKIGHKRYPWTANKAWMNIYTIISCHKHVLRWVCVGVTVLGENAWYGRHPHRTNFDFIISSVRLSGYP